MIVADKLVVGEFSSVALVYRGSWSRLRHSEPYRQILAIKY